MESGKRRGEYNLKNSQITSSIKSYIEKASTGEITSEELVKGIEKMLYTDANQQSINDNLSFEERSILEDISAQWDLYLENSYGVEDLKIMDLKNIKFPDSYLDEWRRELEKMAIK